MCGLQVPFACTTASARPSKQDADEDSDRLTVINIQMPAHLVVYVHVIKGQSTEADGTQ